MIAPRPVIGTIAPSVALRGVRSTASVPHGTRDTSFAPMPWKYAFRGPSGDLSFIAVAPSWVPTVTVVYGYLRQSIGPIERVLRRSVEVNGVQSGYGSKRLVLALIGWFPACR